VVAFFLFVGFVFLGNVGILLGVFGIVDIIIALVYFVGLPKTMNPIATNLLLDRVT
jgi:hypothetical protein